MQKGRELTGIVEKFDGKFFHATTENYLKVLYNDSSKKEKNIIKLRITGFQDGRLFGEPV